LKNPIKQLAGQTAIYGLSSVIGRLLNYLLVPLHVAIFQPGAYGVVTELYAYAAFLAVILVYGMETAFFRFLEKEDSNRSSVFSTGMISLLVSTAIFWAVILIFRLEIADFILYSNHPEYLIWFAFILGADALAALPMARLRALNKPISFALINLGSIGVTIGLNLFFFLVCRPLVETGHASDWIRWIYRPEIGVGYIFLANLAGSLFRLIAVIPSCVNTPWKWNHDLLLKMLRYSIPLMFFGLAGIVNETFDRILLRRILSEQVNDTYAQIQVGIYGANYKLAMLITLFIQAFRYAFEPFLFAQAKKENSPKTYADVMLVFVAITGVIYLLVALFLDWFKYLVIPNEAYWSGLSIVPVLLLANVFLGVGYNLGVWFKLTDRTQKGMIISLVGAVITILGNVLFVADFGYHAAAYTTLAVYFSMAVISWLWGRKYYFIPYEVWKITALIGLPVVLFALLLQIPFPSDEVAFGFHTFIFVGYTFGVYQLIVRKVLKKYTS
jgi:O-antigen/teichoic acid export membrane protein